MKRWLSILLVIALMVMPVRGVSESNKEEDGGFWDSAGGFFGNLWDGVSSTANNAGQWASGAVDDVSKWAEGAVNDAGKWLEGASSDVSKWAVDAYTNTVQWAGDTAGAAGAWLSASATGAWDWTCSTANNTWLWAKGAAEGAWDVTSKTISGTWEGVFGKADDTAGPHHLCISSPLFVSTKFVGTQTDDFGHVVECYQYDSEYDITIIAASREADIMPPSVGDMAFSELVASCYDTISFVDQDVGGVGVRAMAQELRFKAEQDNNPKFGRALGVWTDRYIVAFIIMSDVEMEDDEADVDELKEADEIFDLWVETISIYETKKTEYEADIKGDSDIAAGNITASNLKTANRLLFEEDYFSNPLGGKGFAAENANNLADNIIGIFRKHAEVIGSDNRKNGADRRITKRNGNIELIQTKYHQNAQSTINSCFDTNGMFRYLDADGQPMIIEVPRGQKKIAIEIMERRIRDGKVPNVTDPAKAEEIVREGTVTYKQAKRIAKAGNLDSLTYDAVNGTIESLYSFGISSVVEFAVSRWKGEDIKTSLKLSVCTGLQVGGTSFVVSVLSSQLSKAGLNSLLVNSSEAVVKLMGPKAAATFANLFRIGNRLTGASAMKVAAKLLRNGVITSAVSLFVLTVPDLVEVFRGRIFAKQLMKNVAQTGGGIAGGLAGWYGGAALGSIVPGVGTIIGGIIGSVAGGYVIQMATGAVTNLFAKDDADEMLSIISATYATLAEEYLLNEEEASKVVDLINSTANASMLKDMFASSNREAYAREVILRPLFDEVTENRSFVEIPTESDYQEALIEVLEDIYDEESTMKEAA